MKSILAFPALSVLLATSLAAAQPAAPAPAAPAARTFGLDGIVGLPTGDYGQFADLAFGALARVEVPLGALTFTGRSGAVFHSLDSSEASLVYVPIFAGVRYPLTGTGLFLAGELGLTVAYASVDTGFGDATDTDTELGGSFGLGVRSGSLTFVGGLFLPDLGDALAIGGSVGFDLTTF